MFVQISRLKSETRLLWCWRCWAAEAVLVLCEIEVLAVELVSVHETDCWLYLGRNPCSVSGKLRLIDCVLWNYGSLFELIARGIGFHGCRVLRLSFHLLQTIRTNPTLILQMHLQLLNSILNQVILTECSFWYTELLIQLQLQPLYCFRVALVLPSTLYALKHLTNLLGHHEPQSRDPLRLQQWYLGSLLDCHLQDNIWINGLSVDLYVQILIVLIKRISGIQSSEISFQLF